MKKTNIRITDILMIVCTVVLTVMYLFFERNSDALGYSDMEQKMINAADIVSNIIIPVVILIAVFMKKRMAIAFAAALRSIIYIVPFFVDGEVSDVRVILMTAVSIIYSLVLILYAVAKLQFTMTMLMVVIGRLLVIVLNGTMNNLVYGLGQGGIYLFQNLLYLAATECVFVLAALMVKE